MFVSTFGVLFFSQNKSIKSLYFFVIFMECGQVATIQNENATCLARTKIAGPMLNGLL
ncbi:conserved hypothetical protein [Burkholderia vietnamiensis]|nr:conserved hypothetical protein [Burkholderia vietnamiensis]SOT46049.1 hypothetical protein F01_570035 [Burkholderia cenocepacia]